MIWLIWNSEEGETKADAMRIYAQDCISAAEKWARHEKGIDPAAFDRHLQYDLSLCAQREGTDEMYRVGVHADVSDGYVGFLRDA